MTLRLAQSLVALNWRVEWFSAAYPGAASQEYRDGIDYVRGGSALTVHFRAFLRYRGTSQFSAVIDEVNTVPFFTPLYLRARRFMLMFQLAREVWFYEVCWPLNVLGYILEPLYLLPYRFENIITISRSSRASFREIGLRGPINLVPIATDGQSASSDARPYLRSNDVITVSRLTRSKRIEHSIKAAALLAARGWEGKLHVVGTGAAAYGAELKRLAQRELADRVVFHSRVPDVERSRLMRSSAVLWMTSVREGWGLVVCEAALERTPAVVFDVPGLRDAVRNGVTGFVVAPNAQALAAATARLLAGDARKMGNAAHALASTYSWAQSGAELHRLLNEPMNDSYAPQIAGQR